MPREPVDFIDKGIEGLVPVHRQPEVDDTTSDALDILHRHYVEGEPRRRTALAFERRKAAGKLGRRRPYTEIGIHRVPCLRCGEPSSHQWQVCSLGNKYYGVCGACDVELNRLVLAFFEIDGAKAILDAYSIAPAP